jgi:hypothetical protein
MKLMRITKAEFDAFIVLQSSKSRKPKGCNAAFSTNPSEDAWSFVTWGTTPQQLRKEVRQRSPILDEVVGVFIGLPNKHPRGGRFFIDLEGVYWKDQKSDKHRFVEWVPEEPLETPPRTVTYSEMKAEIAENRKKKLMDSKSVIG